MSLWLSQAEIFLSAAPPSPLNYRKRLPAVRKVLNFLWELGQVGLPIVKSGYFVPIRTFQSFILDTPFSDSRMGTVQNQLHFALIINKPSL